MKRTIVLITCLLVSAGMLIAAAFAIQHARSSSNMVYTDGQSIRLPNHAAQVRDVLWQPPTALGLPINGDDDAYEGRVSFDGQQFFFVRRRAGNNADIYISQRIPGVDERWSDPQPLDEINTLDDELGPMLSADGLTLLFYSNRPGGEGGYDLWISQRDDGGRWHTPANLGNAVNSPYNEYTPAFSPDGAMLYFASNRPRPGEPAKPQKSDWPATLREDQQQRDYDLFVAGFERGEARDVRALFELNSPANEGAPAFSPVGDFLYFASDREGGHGGFDLYRSRIVRSQLQPPTNLGIEINTPANELDPALSMAGFALHFSSDRIDANAANEQKKYALYRTESREVYLEPVEAEPWIDWASLIDLILPSLLWLLLGLLALLALLALLKGVKSRKLSLLARCFLAALAAHLIMLMLLTFWQVTTALREAFEASSTRVVIASNAPADEIAMQVSQLSTDASLQAPAIETPRTNPQSNALPMPTPLVQLANLQSQPIEFQPEELPPQESNQRVIETAMTPADVATPAAQTPTSTNESQQAEMEITQAQQASRAESPTSPSAATSHVAQLTPDSVEIASSAEIPPLTSSLPPIPAHESHAVVDVTTPPAAIERSAVAEPTQQPTIQTAAAPTAQRSTANTSATSPNMPSTSATQLPPVSRAEDAAVDALPLPATSVPPPATSAAVIAASDVKVPETSALATRATEPGASPAIETAASPTASRAAPTSTAAPPMPANAQVQITPNPSANDAHIEIDLPPIERSSMTSAAAAIAPSALNNIATPAAQTSPTAQREATLQTAESPAANAPAAARAATNASQPVATPASTSAIVNPLTSHEADTSATPMNWPQVVATRSPASSQRTIDVSTPSAPGDAQESARRQPQSEPASAAIAANNAQLPTAQRHSEGAPNPSATASTQSVRINPQNAASEGQSSVDSVPLPVAAKISLPKVNTSSLDLAIPTVTAPPAEEFAQRKEETRRELVERMGGSEATERAVELALEWLARHQSEDGRWAAKRFDQDCGECRGGAKFETDIATTGLALLCFLGADHTHVKQGQYQQNVKRALDWLLTQQRDSGDLRGDETMYSHGIATIALAEALGMTRDQRLVQPVQRAINYIAAPANINAGGWRYEPGQPGDTSVLGWIVMALKSAKRAGLEVPQEAFDVASRWLDRVSTQTRPGLYAYQPGHRHSISMTAEGMFVQQLLGASPTQARMQMSADEVMRNLPRWRTDPATYYWYYATLAMYQHQGDHWQQWNEAITEQLLANQRTDGAAAGSWDPVDNWAKIGGRIYQTALCTLCLEVYYRYLPMYAPGFAAAEVRPGGN